MMPAFRSLETRIVVFFVVLLAAVQVAAYLVVSAANERIARREVASQIRVGERVFARVLEQNGRQLSQAAAVLAADFGFREAIATGDSATINSVLANHGARINANLVLLYGPDNRLLGSSLEQAGNGDGPAFPELIRTAMEQGQASSVVLVDRHPYQMVVVPVMAPLPVAWVAMGFTIDDRIAREMRDLTGLQVSFLTERPDFKWELGASTLDAGQRSALLGRLNDLLLTRAGPGIINLGDLPYQTRSMTLTSAGVPQVMAVLQQSLQASLEPFSELQRTLFDLALASVLVSLFGSILIGRSLAGPINRLAAIARRIRDGDYSEKADIRQQDEIGELASSFNHMREAISSREEKILRLAYQDTLTGLPNRALFNDRLDLAIKAARREQGPVTILSMDLDRFKHVNDTLGHPVGDRVLQAVGSRLQGLLRESDTIARLGGDEFAVILPGAGTAAARDIAGKILSALNVPVTIDGQLLDVRTSIGIAGYPEHGEDPYTLIRHADVAMYVAKRGHHGSTVFEPALHQPRENYLTLLGELRRAVEQDELVLHFQPKVDLRSGITAQCEALVRWNHPARGFVPPGDFIPFAEQTGFIRDMTHWILRSAIRQCGLWQARGVKVAISVNICARDLLDPELPRLVDGELKLRGVDARWLCIEITESGVMEDPARSMETLHRLDRLGVKLAIDDYGTGYSSLSYVKKLPVKELKIDQSFVRNMAIDGDDAMIVKSTIELGHNMGMEVVAEGVEDLSIWALLKQMGCDHAQGYCISRPLPAGQFEQWLAANPVFGDPTIPPARLATR